MKKYICGLFDSVSGNVGDICILDNVKEFENGVRNLFSDPAIPDYVVEDCRAVVYGELHYDLDSTPYIVAYDCTKYLCKGPYTDILRKRKEASLDEEDS